MANNLEAIRDSLDKKLKPKGVSERPLDAVEEARRLLTNKTKQKVDRILPNNDVILEAFSISKNIMESQPEEEQAKILKVIKRVHQEGLDITSFTGEAFKNAFYEADEILQQDPKVVDEVILQLEGEIYEQPTEVKAHLHELKKGDRVIIDGEVQTVQVNDPRNELFRNLQGNRIKYDENIKAIMIYPSEEKMDYSLADKQLKTEIAQQTEEAYQRGKEAA